MVLFIKLLFNIINMWLNSYMILCGRKSSRINTTLAVNGLTPLLISRLDHQDAIARLTLLKLIKVGKTIRNYFFLLSRSFYIKSILGIL